MKLSIVITAYTQERLKDIRELLDSINAQSTTSFKTYIVIERSKDLEREINQYICDHAIGNINVIFNDRCPGASASRNIAIQQVDTEFIAFVDDDAVLDSHWVKNIIESFTLDKDIAGITGPILPVWEDTSMEWIPPEFYWIFSCTGELKRDKHEVRNGYGTNLAFRTAVLKSSGLFNPELGVKGRGKKGWQEPGGEETELCLRIRRDSGMKIIYDPQIIVHHKVYKYRADISFIHKRAYWEGYTKALLKTKYKSIDSDLLNTEYSLLKRIFLHRLPKSTLMLFTSPKKSCRQLYLIISVIFCVACGYSSFIFRRIFTK
jgi:glucosyl-dolichyl phosphate glucuronosyltransferase